MDKIYHDVNKVFSAVLNRSAKSIELVHLGKRLLDGELNEDDLAHLLRSTPDSRSVQSSQPRFTHDVPGNVMASETFVGRLPPPDCRTYVVVSISHLFRKSLYDETKLFDASGALSTNHLILVQRTQWTLTKDPVVVAIAGSTFLCPYLGVTPTTVVHGIPAGIDMHLRAKLVFVPPLLTFGPTETEEFIVLQPHAASDGVRVEYADGVHGALGPGQSMRMSVVSCGASFMLSASQAASPPISVSPVVVDTETTVPVFAGFNDENGTTEFVSDAVLSVISPPPTTQSTQSNSLLPLPLHSNHGSAWLGLYVVFDALLKAAKIVRVLHDGPADRADLRPGDYIVNMCVQQLSGGGVTDLRWFRCVVAAAWAENGTVLAHVVRPVGTKIPIGKDRESLPPIIATMRPVATMTHLFQSENCEPLATRGCVPCGEQCSVPIPMDVGACVGGAHFL
jgi:hypothetical protein